MAKYSNQDHYLDAKTGVLKNKLNLSDPIELEYSEAELSAIRSFELRQNPIEGNFDLDHLCAIHSHLFGDVYEWAGEIRDVDIAKGSCPFALHTHIKSAAKPIFEQLAKENYLANLDAPAFSERAAHYLGEINALHPFREGNGRAQRDFINHLARKSGYFIEWKGMSKDDMLTASIESFEQGDNTRFTALIGSNIQTLEADREIGQDQAKTEPPQEQDRTQAAIDDAFGLDHGGDFTDALSEQNIFLAKPTDEESKLYGLKNGEIVAVSEDGIYQLPREQFNAREQAIHGQWFEETQEFYEARDFDGFMERASYFDSVEKAHAETTPERVAERDAAEARFLDEYEAQKAQILGEADPTPVDIERPQEPAPTLGEMAEPENEAGAKSPEWREPANDNKPDLAPSVDEAQALEQGGGQRPEIDARLATPSSHFAFALGDSAPVTQLNPSGPAPEKGLTGVDEARAVQIESGTAEPQIESRPLAAEQGREEGISEPASVTHASTERGEETKADVALEAPQSSAPALAPDALDGVATTATRAVDAGLAVAEQALEVVGDLFEGLFGGGSAPPTEADIQRGNAIAEAQADARTARIAARAEQLQRDIADYQQRQELEQQEGLGLGRKRDE